MKRFAALCAALQTAPTTAAKQQALQTYFAAAPAADAAWVTALLTGFAPRRILTVQRLAEWAAAVAQIEPWLFATSLQAVGNLLETATLVLPEPSQPVERTLADWLENDLLPLQSLSPVEQQQRLALQWQQLPTDQRSGWHQLLTGQLKFKLHSTVWQPVLAAQYQLPAALIALRLAEHRLAANEQPTPAWFAQLCEPATERSPAQPLPFAVHAPWQGTFPCDTEAPHWHARWHWNGVRVQLVRRNQQACLWSAAGELLNARFPDILASALRLPADCILEGELVGGTADEPRDHSALAGRLTRKQIPRSLLQREPAVLLVGDLLHWQGQDVRQRSNAWRQAMLLECLLLFLNKCSGLHRKSLQDSLVFGHHPRYTFAGNALTSGWIDPLIQPALAVEFQCWEELHAAHANCYACGAAGMVLGPRESTEQWLWLRAPVVVRAVLLGAARSGGGAGQGFAEYTFGIWHEQQLIPIAKTTAAEHPDHCAQLDELVRRHAGEKFGPQQSVVPAAVFELALADIMPAPRRKAGLLARDPQLLTHLADLPAAAATTLAELISATQRQPANR